MKTKRDELSMLITEQRNAASDDIDVLSTISILSIINTQDKLVPIAVEKEIQFIARAVEIATTQLRSGGRLIYVGAGTSGRLGILDATECPPTFGTDPEQILGLIAGGPDAVFRSIEGAEDAVTQAGSDIDQLELSEKDVVCGIAASRRTPYVVAAIERAKTRGAKTIFITTNPRSEFNLDVDVAICPEVGPEVIMGSTRMKSGTAQKLVLNMLTTTTMIRLGKVYHNMMVDLQMTNKKLVERAKRIIMLSTNVDYEAAEAALEVAGGHVKTAIIMIKAHVSAPEARSILGRANGHIRTALAGLQQA